MSFGRVFVSFFRHLVPFSFFLTVEADTDFAYSRSTQSCTFSPNFFSPLAPADLPVFLEQRTLYFPLLLARALYFYAFFLPYCSFPEAHITTH